MAVYKDQDELMNTDWQSKINEAQKAGDYRLAAQYEQARNDKINSSQYTGNQATTSNYAGWLDKTDYSAIGAQQMASNASWKDVLDTYNNRLNKTSGTIGMEQFVNDEKQQAMMDYILANKDQPDFGFDMNSQPTFTSSYQTKIDTLLNSILNRDGFTYNAATDPLYLQYQTLYNREGNRAMNDTLASAAAQAGGMNSYAMTAANQANNYYSAQLNDKIPELYQLAYDMYLQDIDNQVRDLGLLQDMDSTQYNRYRDTMSDWRDDRNFAYNAYRDDVADSQWQTGQNTSAMESAFDRATAMLQLGVMPSEELLAKAGISTDQAGDYISNGYQTNQNIDAQGDAYDRAMELLYSGAMPTDELLKKAGMTADQASAIMAGVKAQGGTVTTGGTTSSSSSTSKTNGYDNGGMSEAQIKAMQTELGVTADGKWGSKSQAAAEAKGWGTNAADAWKAYSGAVVDDSFSYLNRDDYTAQENINYTITNKHGDGWVNVIGYTGRVSYEELLNLVESGEVEEVIDKDNFTVTYRKK